MHHRGSRYVGAQAGVPTGKTIRRGQTVWGTPARSIEKNTKKQYAAFARLPGVDQARRRDREDEALAAAVFTTTARISNRHNLSMSVRNAMFSPFVPPLSISRTFVSGRPQAMSN